MIGHHVSKDGSRFSALQPICQAVAARFGPAAPGDCARGITVRADNGPQYVARDFRRQLGHWGIGLSYAFPHQPETNGVGLRARVLSAERSSS